MIAAVGKGVEIIARIPGTGLRDCTERWLALYAKSPLQFTIVTLVIIVTVGAFLGILTDCVMKRLGIDLNSREVREK